MSQQGMVFKVSVEYENSASPPATLAVTKNALIRTAEDAANYCLTLHHKDPVTGDIFKTVKAVPLRDEPFTRAEAPEIRPMNAPPSPPV